MKNTLLASALCLSALCAFTYPAYAASGNAPAGETVRDMATGAEDADVRLSLQNNAGEVIGDASVFKGPEGLLFRVELNKAPEGWHGVHIHKTGDCSDHDHNFQQAGSHQAEGDEKHGFLAHEDFHEGDLPNIWVAENGTAKADFFTEAVDLKDLSDADGSALMIHDKPDDYKTDPSGASGDRIACGIIKPKQ